MVFTSLSTLPAFIAYFTAACALTTLFLWIYAAVTPWSEFTLIGAGNVAASISLGGAVIGFVLPLASVIAHSAGWLDMIAWGVVAIGVQILVNVVARRIAPGLRAAIEAGKVAPAATLAVASLAVGILNAACITW